MTEAKMIYEAGWLKELGVRFIIIPSSRGGVGRGCRLTGVPPSLGG